MTVKSHEYLVITIALFLTAAVAVNFIPFVIATLIAIFAASVWCYDYFLNNRIGFYVSWSCAIVLGILVGLYRSHDFNYPLVFSVEQF